MTIMDNIFRSLFISTRSEFRFQIVAGIMAHYSDHRSIEWRWGPNATISRDTFRKDCQHVRTSKRDKFRIRRKRRTCQRSLHHEYDHEVVSSRTGRTQGSEITRGSTEMVIIGMEKRTVTSGSDNL